MVNARAILGQRLDLLFGGGLFLFCIVAFLVFRPGWPDVDRPGPLALGMMLLNYPHFVASAWLVYGSPAKVRRHRWASVFFPLLLLLACGAAVVVAPLSRLGLEAILLSSSLYLAWHYTGQSWGMVASFANLEGVPPEPAERRLVNGSMKLLLGFHVVWALRFQREFPAVAALTDGLYAFAISLVPVATIVGLVGFVRWARRSRRPTPARVWVPWAALVGWYAAMAFQPSALHLVQLAHAIQYLPFPLRVELNRAEASATATPLRGASRLALAWAAGVALVWLGPAVLFGTRIRPSAAPAMAATTVAGLLLVLVGFASTLRPGGSLLRPCLWGALMLQAGCLVFGFLPAGLSRLGATLGRPPGFAADATAMLFAFVNLHHYFTDGVAWKLRDPEVRRELFAHLQEARGA